METQICPLNLHIWVVTNYQRCFECLLCQAKYLLSTPYTEFGKGLFGAATQKEETLLFF